MNAIPLEVKNMPLGQMKRTFGSSFYIQWIKRTKELKDMDLAFAYTLLDLGIKQVFDFDGIIDVSKYPSSISSNKAIVKTA